MSGFKILQFLHGKELVNSHPSQRVIKFANAREYNLDRELVMKLPVVEEL
jgi:hypothetical protein